MTTQWDGRAPAEGVYALRGHSGIWNLARWIPADLEWEDVETKEVWGPLWCAENYTMGFRCEPPGEAELRGWKACQEAAAAAVEMRGVEIGRAECCGHGVGGYSSPPECCADPLYMMSSEEAARAIRSLTPPKDEPA